MIDLIATQLTDRSARTYRLTLDGQDFLLPAGSTAFGIARDTVKIVENGPGGVSSLTCTLNDPLVQAIFAERCVVEFWDIANDRPDFLGFLDVFNIQPTAVGRTIDLTCIGIEAILDWMMVPALTLPVGMPVVDALQSVVANATGIGVPIRAYAAPEPTGGGGAAIVNSTQALPMGQQQNSDLAYDVIVDGMTLRDALAAVETAAGDINLKYHTGAAADSVFTMDFYYGLRRLFKDIDAFGNVLTTPADDYASPLAIDMTPSGTVAGMGIDFEVNSGGVPHAVYVTGGNAIGSGLVSDGTGTPGPVAALRDDTCLTVEQRDSIGLAYLSAFSTALRGTEVLDPVPPAVLSGDYRPGSTISYAVDSIVFGEASSYDIASITRTFPAGTKEAWTIAYGGLAMSALRQIRRLTRPIRN